VIVAYLGSCLGIRKIVKVGKRVLFLICALVGVQTIRFTRLRFH
jgi:hypothetical protein